MSFIEGWWLVILVATAGAGSYGAGVVLRSVAPRVGLVDAPNERSSHSAPTPRGGGLGIVVSVVGGILVLLFVGVPGDRWLATVAVGGVAVAAISVLDDFSGVRPIARLTVHFVVAAGTVLGVGTAGGAEGGLLTIISSGPISSCIWIVWIVAMINAYNFMDGIDGIAAGQAIVAGAGWALVGIMFGEPALLGVGLLVASASAGFLAHNWSPARLFMGDVGSAFLGYLLGAIGFFAFRRTQSAVLWCVLFVWPFLFDTGFTLFRRLWNRENVFAPHRTHFYQRLVIGGLSHARVAQIYIALATVGAAVAVRACATRSTATIAAVIYACGSGLFLFGLVRWRERETLRE